MELSELSKEIEHLPEKEKNAILALIDLKSRSDMKEVLAKMDSMRAEIHSIKDSMQAEIYSIKDSMRAEIHSIKDSMQAEISGINNSMQSEIRSIRSEISTSRYWISVLIAGIGVLITILKFVKL